MSMTNKVVLNNGDVFRVIQGKGLFSNSWMIQAKEADKKSPRFYTIGRVDGSLADAIAEMDRRAKIANVKGFC